MSVGQPGETGVLQCPGDSPASHCTRAHALMDPPLDVGSPAPHDVPLTNRIRQGDTVTSEVTSQEPGNAHPGCL